MYIVTGNLTLTVEENEKKHNATKEVNKRDCIKRSIVVPVPKKSRPVIPNDFRPVALTSHVMKSFEKITKTMIMTCTDHLLDPLQLAYRPGRVVEDAVATLINYVLCHLEDAKTHAIVLYLDMSSAFNTLQPHLLFKKLISEFKLESELALWVLDIFGGETPTGSRE